MPFPSRLGCPGVKGCGKCRQGLVPPQQAAETEKQGYPAYGCVWREVSTPTYHSRLQERYLASKSRREKGWPVPLPVADTATVAVDI